MWLLLALASAVFAAAVAIFGKLGLKGIDSTLATTLRAVVMAVFLVSASFALKKYNGISNLSTRDWTYIIMAGISGALSWLFYFFALKTGPVGKVAVVDRLSLVFVFMFAALFLGEVLTWKSLTGLLLVVFGAILIVI
jgi:transporter family protein